MSEEIGQQLGHYRLLRLLGQGGFGSVYLGQHMLLSSQVAAIKVLSTRLSQESLHAFEQEAQTIAALVHPHIVRVLDFDITQRGPFLVMDYAPNGTLRQRHPPGRPVRLPLVVSYVQQIASALQYAHKHKIIHRDIKPENMLVGVQKEILLSDFGLAAMAHSSVSQSPQGVAGTIPYMAPEQIQARPCAASDQYALAVCAYEWLTGECLFYGTMAEIALKQIHSTPPSLRVKRPDLGPEVDLILTRALAKDPRQRFATVQSFANAFLEASSVDVARTNTGRIRVPPPFSLQASTPSARTIPAWPGHQQRLVRKRTMSPPRQQSPSLAKAANRNRNGGWQVPVTNTATSSSPHITRRLFLAGGGIALLGGAWVFTQHALSSRQVSGQSVSVIPMRPTAKGNSLVTLYRGHSQAVTSAVWSPDGTHIASGSLDGTVQMWNAANGETLITYRGHTQAVSSVAWSPDGTRVASGSLDGTVQIWKPTNGHNIFTETFTAGVEAIAWSPDSTQIASGGDTTTIQIWDVTNGYISLTYFRHFERITTIAWSPNGKQIVSGSLDSSIRVWNATNGKQVFTYEARSGPNDSIVWSPDGTQIAWGDNATIEIWSRQLSADPFFFRLQTIITVSSTVNGVAWSPDGTRIAGGLDDTTAQVWDTTTGQSVFTYHGHSSVVTGVAWSPDGKMVASWGTDHTVQVWSI